MAAAITDRLGHTPKTLRILAGLTQARLARRAGVSVGTVSAIECGADVSTRKLHAVALALGLPAWELLKAMDATRAPRFATTGGVR